MIIRSLIWGSHVVCAQKKAPDPFRPLFFSYPYEGCSNSSRAFLTRLA